MLAVVAAVKKPMTSKVGIFAGTFDPIHLGHIEFALESSKKFSLGKVVFLIEPKPRFKKIVSNYRDRLAMLKLALADHENLDIIEINQPEFSVEQTLPVLKANYPGKELWLLIGSDVTEHLPSWPNVKELLKEVQIIEGARSNLKSTHLHEVRTKHLKTSSSDARQLLAKGQIPSTIPKPVAEYALKHKLYS